MDIAERSKSSRRRLVVGAIILSAALSGCQSQLNEPTPAEYRLYAGVHRGYDGTGYVAIIDCATDSIVDSFPVPTNEILEMTPSADGRLLASNEWIFDLVTGSQVMQVSPPCGAGVFLVDKEEYLAPTFDSTRVYTVKTFEYARSIPHELESLRKIPFTTRVMGLRGDVKTRPAPNPLIVYDYESDQIVDSIRVELEGEGYIVWSFVVSPDGGRMYAAGRFGASTVIGVDLKTHALLWQYPVVANRIQVTPDGNEIWVGDASFPMSIKVLDAATGAIKHSIPLLGFYPEDDPLRENKALDPYDIRFVPTGKKAYVACGHFLNSLEQPLLVIDTETRTVTKLLFGEFTHLIESLAIAPKP